MEFPSKNLLLTLAQDLKIINNVNEEILSNCKTPQINSWLYPSKSYKEVSEVCLLQNKSGKDLYLNYLELMIDRLYFMINLLIKFTETLIRKDFSRNVMKPNNLALGTCSNYLWKTLLQLKDFIIGSNEEDVNQTENGDKKTLESKNTQTLIYSAETCNSCGFATECIHEIVRELALHIDGNFIDKLRRDFHKDLYDITLQGRMHQITSAIIQDLKVFGEHARRLTDENKRQRNKLQLLESNFTKSIFTIKILRRSLKKFRKRKIDARIKRESLIKRINELIKADSVKSSNILRAKEKSQTLENSLHASTISLALISTDNDNLQREISRTLLENISISSEKDLWKNRFGESYLENRKLKQELGAIRPEIFGLNATISRLSDSCENFMTKLRMNNLKLTNKSETFENMIKKLSDDLPIVRGDVDCEGPPMFKITGNPLADMRKQVEVNIFNIGKLEQHNHRLLKTIKRVQSKALHT